MYTYRIDWPSRALFSDFKIFSHSLFWDLVGFNNNVSVFTSPKSQSKSVGKIGVLVIGEKKVLLLEPVTYSALPLLRIPFVWISWLLTNVDVRYFSLKFKFSYSPCFARLYWEFDCARADILCWWLIAHNPQLYVRAGVSCNKLKTECRSSSTNCYWSVHVRS